MAEARLQYTDHARDMLAERAIPEDWVLRAVADPDRREEPSDGNTHYIKSIPEHGGRTLRVVVNPKTQPRTVVTVFFDRRLRR